MRTKFPNQANDQGRGGALRPPLRSARAFAPKYGRDLSAGERQRLSVVCGLAILLAIAYQIVSFWSGYYNNLFQQLGL